MDNRVLKYAKIVGQPCIDFSYERIEMSSTRQVMSVADVVKELRDNF